MRSGEGVIRADWRVPAWGSEMAASKDAPRAVPKGPSYTPVAVDLTEADDRALVEAFRAGHREAFDVIVVRHRRQVYQLCYRFVNNHEDASDLAQDVFVRAFKGLGRFKGDSSIATWLHRVSVNACLNRVAVKKPATAPLDAAVHVDARAGSPLDDVLRGERAEAVRQAIAQLPPKQRATLMLRIYQDCSHQEIADALGSTVGAVKANFFHALGNLRRMLKT
jgi:RNA polymerase sigma-70 factor, ECF subfamily